MHSANPTAVSPKKLIPLSLRRFSRRLVRVAVLAYLSLCVLVYLGQNRLAFPGMMAQGKPETRIQYSGDVQTLHLSTANGIPIAAVFNSNGIPHSPTVLYFYGNAGSVAGSEDVFFHFHQLGCNVLIPDLAGFGASGGKPSEANFYATADTAWNYLQSRTDIDKDRIIVVGWSMGAAVAVDLASRKTVAGLATFNAFTNLHAMARLIMPLMPTGILLKYNFDNKSKMPAVHCPALICSGRLDTLVPPKMSDQLAASAGGPVTRVVIPTADHNSIFTAEPDTVWPALARWLDTINAAHPTP